MMVHLRMLVTFTHTATWKILKGKGEARLTTNIPDYLLIKEIAIKIRSFCVMFAVCLDF